MRLALAVSLATLVILPLGVGLLLGWLPAIAALAAFTLMLAWLADPAPF